MKHLLIAFFLLIGTASAAQAEDQYYRFMQSNKLKEFCLSDPAAPDFRANIFSCSVFTQGVLDSLHVSLAGACITEPDSQEFFELLTDLLSNMRESELTTTPAAQTVLHAFHVTKAGTACIVHLQKSFEGGP